MHAFSLAVAQIKYNETYVRYIEIDGLTNYEQIENLWSNKQYQVVEVSQSALSDEYDLMGGGGRVLPDRRLRQEAGPHRAQRQRAVREVAADWGVDMRCGGVRLGGATRAGDTAAVRRVGVNARFWQIVVID
uniref:Uncharacterized protein n=1 Tax=Oryza brachyantha TaxID=4533 RepID=J3LVG5_ORYBR